MQRARAVPGQSGAARNPPLTLVRWAAIEAVLVATRVHREPAGARPAPPGHAGADSAADSAADPVAGQFVEEQVPRLAAVRLSWPWARYRFLM